MSHSDFVHLHVHSHYSMLQATGKTGDLIKTAKKLGMPALAITDHANLFGAVEFYKKAMAAGVTPIIGCEMFVSEGSRFDQKRDWHRLVLLCRSNKGYANLAKMVSRSYTEGFFKKPRIDLELLEDHKDGLIALTSMLEGPLAKKLLAGLADEAAEWCLRYKEMFGVDPAGEPNFFIEVQDHGLPEEKMVGHRLVKLAQDHDVPMVLTNDVHYLKQEDAVAHQALMFIGQGRQLNVEEGKPVDLLMGSDQFYFKTPEEMKEIGRRFPGAYENTVKISRRCHMKFEFGDFKLPRFEVPDGYDADSYLYHLCEEALPQRYPDADEEEKKKLHERLEFEHKIIKQMGYSAYFLITWDFIKAARDMGIPVGPGRGSAAGSLIAYLTAITNIDPLKYGLYFERFLNPERVSMPDVDIDFDYERRGEVIEYVIDKYGKDCVSQIITFGTLSCKAALKDVARVMGLPFHISNAITKAVPAELFITLERALADSKELAKFADEYPMLFQVALAIEGCARNAGTHAAGIVIAPAPLETLSPLYSRDGDIATQYNMKAIDDMGLLKMDFLGLKTLTVLKNASNLIAKNRGIRVDLDAIPLDDLRTYALLAAGETLGVFQFESSGFRDLLRRVQPGVFEDLIALLALYRPGPLGSGMVDDFIETKHGRKSAKYPHPKLEELLRETYGVMLYQEQVMACASILAGYSLGQADQLRRAMGKKKVEEMERHRQIFIKESTAREVDPKNAGEIFDLMEKFAGYGFNKSHSAAYALVSYQTAFLKANFPTEFLAAVLTNEASNTDQIAKVFEECGRLDIAVRGPDINRSERHFTVEGEVIFFGLEAIKGLGSSVVDAVLAARESGGPFQGMADFFSRVDLRAVNRRAVEALVKAGAFDYTGRARSQLLAVVDQGLSMGQSNQAYQEQGQGTLLDFCATQGGEFADDELDYPDIPEFPERDVLNFEKESLGFYLSGHPLHEHRVLIDKITEVAVPEVLDLPADTGFLTAGIIKGVRMRRIKTTGRDMAIVELEDLTGTFEFAIFSEVLDLVREILLEDEIVVLSGKIVRRRDDEKKVEVGALVRLEDLGKTDTWGVDLYVRAEADRLGGTVMARLKNTLLGHPGTRRVTFELRVDNATVIVQLGGGFRVEPNRELVEALESLCGADSVRLDLRAPPPPERQRRRGPPPPPPKPKPIKAVADDRAGPPRPEELDEAS